MSEEMLMINYLSLLKSNVEVYVHGTIESSHNNIRNILKEGLDDTLDSQKRIYDLLVQCDYYIVEDINKSDIKKSYDKLMNK